jgi:hypothetical protein
MAVKGFYAAPPPPPDAGSWLRQLWEWVDLIRTGKMDCVTEITLTANAATTTFADKRLSPQSVVTFDPRTANAAAELQNGTMYVLNADRGKQSWTITHSNNAQTDRTYSLSIIG